MQIRNIQKMNNSKGKLAQTNLIYGVLDVYYDKNCN